MILIDRFATLILYCIVTAQNDVSLLNDVNRIALNQAEREAYSLFFSCYASTIQATSILVIIYSNEKKKCEHFQWR